MTAQFGRGAVGAHRRPLWAGRRVRAGLANFVVTPNRGRSTLGNAAIRQIARGTRGTSVGGIPFASGPVATLAKVVVAAVVPRRETLASSTTAIRRITDLGNRVTRRATHPPRVVRGALLQLVAGAAVGICRRAANVARGIGGVTNSCGQTSRFQLPGLIRLAGLQLHPTALHVTRNARNTVAIRRIAVVRSTTGLNKLLGGAVEPALHEVGPVASVCARAATDIALALTGVAEGWGDAVTEL